ncbi:MAG: LytTR family DNA-binding domain-containing protein [Bacteroidota bacterium]
MWLKLNYDLLKSWKVILVTAFLTVSFYLSIIYFSPENMDWIGSEYFSMGNLLWFVLVDQYLIECVTVGIVFSLIRVYAHHFNLFEIKLEPRHLFYYELKFLPVLLLSFFVFAPFSLSLRYLLHYAPNLDSSIYFEQYFYSVKLYLNYLFPVILFGYVIINVNLIKTYNEQLEVTKSDLSRSKKRKKDRLWARDEFGELFLEVDTIIWIQRSERKTYAQTSEEKYRLKETISELEEKLDPTKFLRVNRSAIVNLDHMLNYSFWENEKYILRIKNYDQEFVMSRERLNRIKSRFVTSEAS